MNPWRECIFTHALFYTGVEKEEDDWLSRSCPIHLDDVISALTRLSNRAIPLWAVDRRRSGALSSDPIRLLLQPSVWMNIFRFHGYSIVLLTHYC
jgi:hypothetical protein